MGQPLAPYRPADLALEEVFLNVVYRRLEGGNLLGFLVWHLAVELVLEREDQIHHIERISAEIIEEGTLPSHVFPFEAKISTTISKTRSSTVPISGPLLEIHHLPDLTVRVPVAGADA